MASLDKIFESYNNIKVLHGKNLREDMFLKRLLFEFCKDLHTSEGMAGVFDDMWSIQIPKSFSHKSDWSIVKHSISQFFKSRSKIINVSLKNNLKLMIGHYIESLYAFERSIFWFFNYKHNLDPFNQVASEQALYYAEFFSIVAITRFLGGSLNHTPFGLFKIIINWENINISIHHRPSLRSSHGGYKDLFYEVTNNLEFSDYEYMETLRNEFFFRDRGFLMIEDRRENVYDLSSRMSDPFKNASHFDFCEPSIKATRSWTFLEGFENLSFSNKFRVYDENLVEFLENEYADEGYRQHHIGEYWKFLIYVIKKLKGATGYLESLVWKIKRFDECESVELDESTKEILLRWINEGD